jgi:hypothetical protein
VAGCGECADQIVADLSTRTGEEDLHAARIIDRASSGGNLGTRRRSRAVSGAKQGRAGEVRISYVMTARHRSDSPTDINDLDDDATPA